MDTNSRHSVIFQRFTGIKKLTPGTSYNVTLTTVSYGGIFSGPSNGIAESKPHMEKITIDKSKLSIQCTPKRWLNLFLFYQFTWLNLYVVYPMKCLTISDWYQRWSGRLFVFGVWKPRRNSQRRWRRKSEALLSYNSLRRRRFKGRF